MKLAFYKGRGHFFNRLVAWWTNGKYSHVEVILGRLENGDYTCLSSSFRDGGVRVKNMPLPSEKWDIVMVNGDPRVAREWADKYLGAKYDVPGLFGFVWRRNIDRDQRWFCSEVAADILGLLQPSRFDPNSLYSVVRSSFASF